MTGGAILVSGMALAEAANTKNCAALMQAYKDEGSTVPQMQAYSSCVSTLYPESVPVGVDLIILKVAVSLVFLGAAVGGIKMNCAEYPGRFMNIALGLLCGASVAAGTLLAVAAASLGVKFLFS